MAQSRKVIRVPSRSVSITLPDKTRTGLAAYAGREVKWAKRIGRKLVVRLVGDDGATLMFSCSRDYEDSVDRGSIEPGPT